MPLRSVSNVIYRNRRPILAVCVILAAWAVIGAPNLGSIYSVNRYIDIRSGEVRSDRRLGSILIYRHVATTEFSELVKRLGVDIAPPEWRQLSAKYYPSLAREDFQYTGAVEACNEAERRVVTDTGSRAAEQEIIVRYLRLLASGNIRAIENDTEMRGNGARGINTKG